MSEQALSETELSELLSELSQAAADNLQKIFTEPPHGGSWDDLKERLARGQSLRDICQLPDDYMESSYQEGKARLQDAEYDAARTIFSTLALYDDRNPRYWAALGKSCEALKLYPEALRSYQMLTLVTGGLSPSPYLCQGYCHLALGDMESAREALELGREICDPYDDEQRPIYDRIEQLLTNCR